MLITEKKTYVNRGKFFTYVTKTCANLTTYSRKPWNYNGTIHHEKVLPNQLRSLSNLTFSQMFWLFCSLLFQLFSAEHKVSETEEKCYFGFDGGNKYEFQFEWKDLFMISISKIIVPL